MRQVRAADTAAEASALTVILTLAIFSQAFSEAASVEAVHVIQMHRREAEISKPPSIFHSRKRQRAARRVLRFPRLRIARSVTAQVRQREQARKPVLNAAARDISPFSREADFSRLIQHVRAQIVTEAARLLKSRVVNAAAEERFAKSQRLILQFLPVLITVRL